MIYKIFNGIDLAIFKFFNLSFRSLNASVLVQSFVFIKWYISALTIDKLDSPFLFKFYNSVVAKKIEDLKIDEIELLRRKFIQNRTRIIKTDYGAGSSIHRSKKTTIAGIAQSAVSSHHKCHLLYKIVQLFKVHNILELGTSLGISTLYLYAANLQNSVTTVEGDDALYHIFKQHQPPWSQKIDTNNCTFSKYLQVLPVTQKLFDLVFIDGAHRSDMLMPVVQQLQQVVSSNCILIFDDIHWSKDMTQFWDKLRQDKQYNVKIDLWYFGILCFNPKIKEPIDVKISPINFRWKPGVVR